MKKIKTIIVSLIMFFGILTLALGSQELVAQQVPDAPEIEECDTCQHNRRQANVACIRGFWSGGSNGIVWVGDRMKCVSDEDNDCAGETACSNENHPQPNE